MSISSISSLSTQANASLDSASSSLSSNSTKNLATSQIKEVLSKTASEGGNSSDSLYSALVSLSSQNVSAPDSDSLSLYDAKGLLLKVKSSLMQDNPLYATGSGSAEASDFTGAYSNTTSSGSTSELDTRIEALLDKYAGTGPAIQTVTDPGTNPGNTTGSKSSKEKN